MSAQENGVRTPVPTGKQLLRQAFSGTGIKANYTTSSYYDEDANRDVNIPSYEFVHHVNSKNETNITVEVADNGFRVTEQKYHVEPNGESWQEKQSSSRNMNSSQLKTYLSTFKGKETRRSEGYTTIYRKK